MDWDFGWYGWYLVLYGLRGFDFKVDGGIECMRGAGGRFVLGRGDSMDFEKLKYVAN